jgi:hypothetical protein
VVPVSVETPLVLLSIEVNGEIARGRPMTGRRPEMFMGDRSPSNRFTRMAIGGALRRRRRRKRGVTF